MSSPDPAASRTADDPPPKRTVAVVVPLSRNLDFSEEDRIAIRHILHYLPNTDRFMIAPRSARFRHPDFNVLDFPDRFFGSLNAHTRMLLTTKFYEAFLDYDYILFHHLDALVLDSRLEDWCRLGYDFIGAPRLGPVHHKPFVVGNGGFALRRVRSYLEVLRSRRYAVDPELYWQRICQGRSTAARLAYLPRRYLKRLHFFNGIKREIAIILANGSHYEDIFMTENATKYYPAFRFAPHELALRFAFDEVPRTCFEMNGFELPFGCHAWYKQDRQFWEPYILPG